MTDNDEIWGYLETLFGTIPDDYRSELMESFEERSFTEGECVVTEGAASSSLFMVTSGELQVYLSAPEGTVELTRLGPGQVFGEVSLLDPGPASASVKGVVAGTLLAISNARLLELYETNPKRIAPIMRHLATHLATNLRRSSQGTLELRDGAWKLEDRPKRGGGLLDWLTGLIFGEGGQDDAH